MQRRGNYSSGDDFVLEYGDLRFTFNERDFRERCEQAARRLGFIGSSIEEDEAEDLINLVVNGEVTDPASALGEHVNDCWPELVGPSDRSLVHWLRRLIFRSAWLDQRVKEGELDVSFDVESASSSTSSRTAAASRSSSRRSRAGSRRVRATLSLNPLARRARVPSRSDVRTRLARDAHLQRSREHRRDRARRRSPSSSARCPAPTGSWSSTTTPRRHRRIADDLAGELRRWRSCTARPRTGSGRRTWPDSRGRWGGRRADHGDGRRLSHDPHYIGDLITAAQDADLVLGSRYVAGGGVRNWGPVRRLISRGGGLYAV